MSEGASGGHPVQPLCSNKSHYMTVSSQILMPLRIKTLQLFLATSSSAWSPSEWKESFIIFNWNVLHFSLCPLPPVLSLDISDNTLRLCCLLHPFKYSDILISFPEASLPHLISHSKLSLLLYVRCFNSKHLCEFLLDALHYVHVSLVLAWTQHSGCVSPERSRGEVSPPSTCWHRSF